MKSLGLSLIGLCLACWVVFFLQLLGLVRVDGSLPLSYYALYSAASALGWVAGTVYVQRTRRTDKPQRRRVFLVSFFFPPGCLFLLRSMAPLAAQRQAPLVPFWALCVFAIFFLVPVSLRGVGRGGS